MQVMPQGGCDHALNNTRFPIWVYLGLLQQQDDSKQHIAHMVAVVIGVLAQFGVCV